MTFDIRFLPTRVSDEESGQEGQLARIELGDYWEEFVVPFGHWDAAGYKNQWAQAVERLITEAKPSCLITYVLPAELSDLVRWWLLYPRRDTAAVREGILIRPELAAPFDPALPYDLIPPYYNRNEEGKPISEWILPLLDFAEFHSRRSPTKTSPD